MTAVQAPLEGRWAVTHVNGRLAPPGAFMLEFRDGNLSAYFGCNSGSTSYRVAGNVIETGPMAATRMACEPVGDEPQISFSRWEDWGFAIVGQTMRVTWTSADSATLSSGGGSLAIKRAAAR